MKTGNRKILSLYRTGTCQYFAYLLIEYKISVMELLQVIQIKIGQIKIDSSVIYKGLDDTDLCQIEFAVLKEF